MDEQEQLKAEIKALADLFHPCIVDLIEVLTNETSVFMVMQYCPGGELYDVIRAKGALNEEQARRHFQRLIQGVDFCHKKRIYHRYLKPENLFLDENGDLCIGDFGLAALREDEEDNNLRTICGTPHFAAPEVMGGSRRLVGNKNFKTVNTKTRAEGYDGAPADVWSCGCILYFLLTGVFPFDVQNFVQLQMLVQKTEPYFAPQRISKPCEKLIRGMLVKDPAKRWTIEQVMKSSWFKTDYEPVQVQESKKDSRHYDDEDPALEEFWSPDTGLVVKTAGESSMSEVDKMRPIKQLNAFELINLAAFDVESIFDEDENTVSNATRFMSKESVDNVQAAVIKRAEQDLNTVAKRKTLSRVTFEDVNNGVVVTMRTYQVIPGVCVYDFSRDEGGRDRFHAWFQKLRDPSGPVGALINIDDAQHTAT